MSVYTASLSRTVSAMRSMVPAKDFETSKRFYIELGFRPRQLTDRLVRDAARRVFFHPTRLLRA
jgi:catechol 2,3-dioxygenase-like lactoylglutathione lyase family enzyme